MVIVLIVVAVVVLLAVVLGYGGFGGFGGGPVVHRRVIYRRRPVRRVYTEHHVVDEVPPVDAPTYRP
jgi:hypothetical protein